jgi:1-deoxy-D-xylulose-5-phosphate synthase
MSRLIENINHPADLNKYNEQELKQICQEIRDYIIEVITVVGGHLGASLGVVELTVALHKVFDSPRDVFCWDVGHQAYVHKILTGRRESFPTIRQYKGISGFLKRSESEHDHFGAGHASTSISAAAGFAEAARLKGESCHSTAIIGDGSLTGGMAFEALNYCGNRQTDMLVVLNDNNMSISPNVGAVSRYLTEMTTSPKLNKLRDQVWEAMGLLPDGTKKLARELGSRLEESLLNIVSPGMLFDDMGFRYFGPVDGHDLPGLIHLLDRIKDIKGPRILHVITKKGKGLDVAEKNPTKYHGVGASIKASELERVTVADRPHAPSYNSLVYPILQEEIKHNPQLVAITAAMAEGTGLSKFAAEYPDNFHDVGIAEAHAVTLSAAMAAAETKPVVFIYSTFLQRAYDQVIHDIALQKLPVTFMLDRAGLVGADGPTHHGTLDLAYMATVPGMIVAAPRDGNELRDLVRTSLSQKEQPFAIRYPKDNSFYWDADAKASPLVIGSWEKLKDGSLVAFIAVGSMVQECIEASKMLAEHDLNTTVVNARFIKPFDKDMLAELAGRHLHLICVEEGTSEGGLGSRLRLELDKLGFAGKFNNFTLGDCWVEHGDRSVLLDDCGLTADRITARVLELNQSE